MHRTRAAIRIAAVLATLPLVSCGSRDNSAFDVAVVAGADDPLGDRIATADRLTHAATVEGLVAFDEAGRVIPALAERWIVTDDGQSYIFRLRDGDWPGGDPLTAESVRRAIRAALKDVAGTPFALDLAGIDDVRAMAGRVIEIRLDRPMPYLLQLLAQPELGLYHEKRGAGPMAITRAGAVATLAPVEPSTLGLPAIEDWEQRTRPVRLHTLSGQAAVDAFNDGRADLVLGGHIQDFLLTRSVGILRGTIQIDPVVGLFGLQVMNDRDFLGEPGNREALALAIDRDALVAPFGVGGWAATTRIVTPSLDGDLGTIGERWTQQTLEERRAVAASRVRAWQAPARQAQDGQAPSGQAPARAGETPAPAPGIRLRLWLPEGGGTKILFDRLAADFGSIGVGLDRAADLDGADLALVDDVARYPRPAWYLNRLSCHVGHGLCSTEADGHVAAADAAASPTERAALLTQAEAELTAANVFIPFGTPIRWSLVRGNVDGFSANAWGWHPLMPLSRLPK